MKLVKLWRDVVTLIGVNMKKLKWGVCLAAFLIAPVALSAPKTNSTAPTKESKEVKKETKESAKDNKTPLTVDGALSISVKNREMVVDKNGQALSQFKYTITNKSDKPIANIQWISVYVNERQVIYSQDMQLDLENTLKPNQSVSINLQIPFTQIEEKYRPIFIDTKSQIQVYKVARTIEFSDKKTLKE